MPLPPAIRRFVRKCQALTAAPMIRAAGPLMRYAARTGVGIDGCRKSGVQPVLIHFYDPVPEYETLPDSYFRTPRDLPGIQIDADIVRSSLRALAPFASECQWSEHQQSEGTYYYSNPNFGRKSASLLHAIIRASRTKRLIEVGSGFSSLVSLGAMALNEPDGSFELTCIEPYPLPWLETLASKGEITLLRERVETVDPDFFASLGRDDILFIDSSHVAKLNSDVIHIYLRVLPRLNSGVIVHVHDIFTPYDYDPIHFRGRPKRFWNEQYMLEALLSGGGARYEIFLPGNYAVRNIPDAFKATFPWFDPSQGSTSSFWFRVR